MEKEGKEKGMEREEGKEESMRQDGKVTDIGNRTGTRGRTKNMGKEGTQETTTGDKEEKQQKGNVGTAEDAGT